MWDNKGEGQVTGLHYVTSAMSEGVDLVPSAVLHITLLLEQSHGDFTMGIWDVRALDELSITAPPFLQV